MTRLLLIALACACSGLVHADQCGPRRVAFSFDDPPLGDSAVMTGDERTERIIKALKEGGIDEAMFFAVGARVDDVTIARMHAYAAAGHVIASHSNTHANLHLVGAARFLADVSDADRVLSGLPGFQRFLRYPYLNEGSSVEERDAVRRGLQALGYRAGYVTIDNWDFFINNLLVAAYEASGSARTEAFRKVYVDTIHAAAEHYDALACRWLDRSPAHVLLLHENDAAALFLPDLIAAFAADGWKFVDATQAYADPIAAIEPDTLALGQGRIAALANIAGAEPAALRHPGENGEQLRAALAAARAEDPDALAIRATARRFSAAYVNGDIDALLGAYADDAVISPPGRGFLSGDDVREYWTPRAGIEVTYHAIRPERIVVLGDIAYDWGVYEGAMGPVGEPRAFSGKYLVVWRKGTDGRWRMVQDMWNRGEG